MSEINFIEEIKAELKKRNINEQLLLDFASKGMEKGLLKQEVSRETYPGMSARLIAVHNDMCTATGFLLIDHLQMDPWLKVKANWESAKVWFAGACAEWHAAYPLCESAMSVYDRASLKKTHAGNRDFINQSLAYGSWCLGHTPTYVIAGCCTYAP